MTEYGNATDQGITAYNEAGELMDYKVIENLYDESWQTKVRKIILLKLGNENVDIESVSKELVSLWQTKLSEQPGQCFAMKQNISQKHYPASNIN